MAELSIREILEQRERELLNQFESVSLAYARIADEIQQVRTALNAITAPMNPFDKVAALLVPRGPSGTLGSAPTGPTGPTEGLLSPRYPPEQMASLYGLGPDPIAHRGSLADVDFATLSIKELVLQVLKARLNHGATSNEILEAINEVSRRPVDRSSLSPTLSRMKAENILKLVEGGKWKIVDLFD